MGRLSVVPPHLADMPVAVNRLTAAAPYYYTSNPSDDLTYQVGFAGWDGSKDGAAVQTGGICEDFYVDESIWASPGRNTVLRQWTINGTALVLQVGAGDQVTAPYTYWMAGRVDSSKLLNQYSDSAMDVIQFRYYTTTDTTGTLATDTTPEGVIGYYIFIGYGSSRYGAARGEWLGSLNKDLFFILAATEGSDNWRGIVNAGSTWLQLVDKNGVPGTNVLTLYSWYGNSIQTAHGPVYGTRMSKSRVAFYDSYEACAIVNVGDPTSRASPLSSFSVPEIWSGFQAFCGLTHNLLLACWGDNFVVYDCTSGGVVKKAATPAGGRLVRGLLRINDSQALAFTYESSMTYAQVVTAMPDGSLSFGNKALFTAADTSTFRGYAMPHNRVLVNYYAGGFGYTKILAA